MAKRLKELYLAQNFADLNKQSEVVGSFNLSPDRILGSMEKAFDSARKDQDAGDEELAYVKFMRVIALGTQLRTAKNCSDLVNRRLTVVVSDALQRAETLHVSLSKRYSQREEQKQRLLAQQQQQQQSSTPVVTNGVVDGPAGLASIDDDVDDGDMDEILSEVAMSTPAVTSVGNNQTINCMMLARHVERGDYSLLVLDCRPKDDFLASHIQHQWVVNVPSNSVQPGMTAHAIETILPDVSRSRWQKRHDVDMLVLMDWGSDPPQNPIQPKLAALLGALKLDYDKTYRSTSLVLQGGYEAWLSQFPQLTTNPNVNKPADEPASNGTSAPPSVVDSPWKSSKSMLFPSLSSSSSTASTTTTKDAADERKSRSTAFYPKLEGFSLKKRPTTATSMEETDVGFHRKRGHHSPHAPTPASAPALVPTVNRSTKPAFLDRMLRKKASNGTVSPVGSVTSLDSSSISPFSSSSIPFETSKPSVDRGKKPPELVASLVAAKREAERIDDEYLAEIRAAEQNERELRLLELEASRMSSLKRNKEHEERERRLLDRLRKSEEARKKLSEEAERNREEVESLRAKLWASGESVAANGQYQDENNQDDEMDVVHEKAAEKLRLEQEVRRMREERKAAERRRREKEQQEEEDRRKREAEMEALRERQQRIEEEKRKKREAEEARIKAELAERKRAEEQEKRDREEQAREHKRKVEATEAKRRTIYHERLKEDESGSSGGGGGGSPGGLTRSHSSPNIDQLGTASPERGSSASSTTSYDKQLKRREYDVDQFLCRRRNFAEVHGTTVPGRTGLKNLGNTCYMNATIQCLGNAPFLTKYFMEQKFLDDLNTNCDTKGEMACELYVVLRHLWCARFRNIAMHDFKDLVGKYYSLFRGYEQQDCHEFLVTLLAWLRDDLNRVKTKTRSVSLDIDKIPDDVEAAKVAWAAFIATEHSIFTDSFGGLQKSTLVCEDCGHISRTFEPIFELSLPLPSKNRCSLEDCIREYLNGERLADRVCPRCRRKGHTIKKFHVWKFPHILIIHLKRFEKGGGRLEKKLQNLVDFRLDDLDLTEFSTAPPGADVPTSSSPTKFDLFAVTNHYGTMDGGHYTAYCRNRGKSWCRYDDQSVSDIPAKDVKSAAAYVLYFAEKNLLNPLCYPKL